MWGHDIVPLLVKLRQVEGGTVAAVDNVYRAAVASAASKAEVDDLFVNWWRLAYKDGADKTALLDRWFGQVLADDRVHGAKLPLYATSSSSEGELTDDSAGLVCEPSTAATAGRDDFARLPQWWILEVSAEKDADGTMTVYKVQHIDPIEEVRDGTHLCQVLQKNTYFKEWQADGYHFYRQQCAPFEGAELWAPANPQGVTHAFAARPKYMAGMKNGVITVGTGLAPVNRASHEDGVGLWRQRSALYSGGSFRVAKWQLVMFALKYARKGNSGLIEGCTGYNYQYTAAVSETGVERVIVTTSQAANLLVGSTVQVGSNSGGTDRNTAAAYNICDGKKITAIEEVEIDGTTYAAVSIDNGGSTFNTTAGTTLLSTAPWHSGRCDGVKGNDGSYTNNANGKEPGMIQGTEFGIGAYQIISDESLNWTKDGDNYYLDIYTCGDQAKVSKTAITSDYTKVAGGTITAPGSDGWQYIQDMMVCPTNWPLAIGGGAGSGTGCRAALGVSRGSGVRASWCFGSLLHGGLGGLPCRLSGYGPGSRDWSGALGGPSAG